MRHYDDCMQPTLVVSVPGMSCGHCETAVRSELLKVAGVTQVDVDLVTKVVQVLGSDDLGAVRVAIDEAGFEVGECKF
jgi:copper chaperone